jgi:lipopolysaccharide biosynthesis glycosyltransferase
MAAPLISSASVQPIHVGRARSAAPVADMIGDDTGDHVSDKNAQYCELTALYWAWRNDDTSSHIGLMHYRRVLDMGNAHPQRVETRENRFDSRDYLAGLEGWLNTNADIDLVVPRAHTMGRSMASNYLTGHHPQDWDLTRRIIAEHHPDDLATFDAVAAQYEVRLGNMFLMRRDLFEAYCTWLFDILARLEAWDVDRTQYSVQQSRYLGYVAERLLTVWVARMAATRPDLKVHEVGILNLSEALVIPWINGAQFNRADDVNVAFAADRAYLPHTAAMLASMLDYADDTLQLNLFFLHSNVDGSDLEMLREVTAPYPHATLYLINAGAAFEDSYRSASRAPSNTTYNRFLLFDLLPGLKRLLYVDVDMIFCGDIAEIWDTDMGDAQLAAVTDYIMTRTLTGPTPTVDTRVPDLYRYQRDMLGMDDAQIAQYFNAGLLLLNLEAMDLPRVSADLMKMAHTGKYLFRDQDIMNSYFKGLTMQLPARFNVFNTVLSGFGRVPREGHAAAMAGRRDPLIIHYAAGDYKPWNGLPVPMAQPYWNALIKTPFYAEVIAALDTNAKKQTAARGPVVKAALRVSERYPALRPALLRGYAALKKLRK